jgi:hypothetical protein
MDENTDRERPELRPRERTASDTERRTRHELVFHGTRFALSDADVERVENEIVAAARSGGALVRIRTSALAETEILVTAATPIRLEHIVEEPYASAGVPGESGDGDDDAYLDHPLWYDFDEL